MLPSIRLASNFAAAQARSISNESPRFRNKAWTDQRGDFSRRRRRTTSPQKKSSGSDPLQNATPHWGQLWMPIDITERSLNARRKATTKRTRSGKTVHDFRGLLGQLGKLTMIRIEPWAGKAGTRRPLAADSSAGAAAVEREDPHAVAPPRAACPVDAQPDSGKYAGRSKSWSK